MFNIGKTIAAVGREPLSSSSTRVGFVCRFNGILGMSLSVKVSSFAVGVLLLLQTLSACAPTAPQNGSASTSSQQTSTLSQQASSREQIVLAIPSNSESEEGYDPTLGWGRYGSPLFQSTLLRRDENLKLVNDLATNYTVSKNKKVWTVTIRNDAMFSDGTPLTAEDVAYTFNKAAQSGGLTDVTVLDKAVAIDDRTVELRLKQPQSTFVNRLVTLGIVPKHAHGPDYARKPIGSGPNTVQLRLKAVVMTRKEGGSTR